MDPAIIVAAMIGLFLVLVSITAGAKI